MTNRLEDRWECGVCWTVYDPRDGDDVAQVEPGTPFHALPDDWRCPHCDGSKLKFLRIDDDRGCASAQP